jgi:MipA family protein
MQPTFKQTAAALLLACAGAPALAEPTHMMMPEGSSEVSLALALVSSPRRIGSAENVMGVAPLISAQWANGVFINLNTVGMHLSDQSNTQYGPLISPTRSRVTKYTPSGPETKSRFTPEIGGFFNYHLAHGIGLKSRLMYGGSSDHRGVRMQLGAHLWQPVAAHHAIGIETGLTLANRSSLQADFGVTPQQAGTGRAHAVSSGLRDASVSLNWRWELNHKTTLHSWIEGQRFLGSAGASPRLEQRSGTSVVAMVIYRY